MATTAGQSTPARRASGFNLVIGGTILGALGVAFVLSFVAIIYAGAARVHLESGIAHALLGAAVMAVAGALSYGHRATLCQPQDVTAILLASGVTGLMADMEGAAPARAEATLLTLVAFAALLTGLGTWVCGRLRIGAVGRFLPYPVVVGFLAATGLLLVIGAIGMSLKSDVSLATAAKLFAPETLSRWAPWIIAAAGIAALVRLIPGDITLPATLLSLLAGFYGWLALSALDLAGAGDSGLLLGPFEGDGFLGALNPLFFLGADWGAVLRETPTVLGVVALALFGSLLNGTGLDMSLRLDSNPESDLIATGRANAATGLFAGLPGYQLIGETVLAHRLGLTGWAPSLIVAAALLAALVVGASALESLPIGFFAAVVAYLGFDLLWDWFWMQRRRLNARDLGLVVGIMATAVSIGFLEALVLGLLAAMLFFLATYARIDVVRLHSTAAHRRSRVERPPEDLARLTEAGRDTVILELEGFLFFGTAARLRDEVRRVLGSAPARLILDFTRVSGADASVQEALTRIATDCGDAGCALILTAPVDGLIPQGAASFASLDAGLEAVEDKLLGDARDPGELSGQTGWLAQAIHEDIRAQRHVTRVTLSDGETLIRQGDRETQFYLLEKGRIRAEVTTPSGGRARVALFAPGALIGELAYYAGLPRTADLIAETSVAAYRIDIAALEREAPDIAGRLHRHAARTTAMRLARMTALARDAGL